MSTFTCWQHIYGCKHGRFGIYRLDQVRPEFLDSRAARNHGCARRKNARVGGVDLIQCVKVSLAEHLRVEEIVGARHGELKLIKCGLG